MHIRLIFRNRLPFKQRDTLEGNIPGVGRPGRKGPKISREVFLDEGEKSSAVYKVGARTANRHR